jgi:hypothetical protein
MVQCLCDIRQRAQPADLPAGEIRRPRREHDGWGTKTVKLWSRRCHLVGAERATQPIEAAKHSIGPHHGPAYRLQAYHFCQDLDLWRRRLVEIELAWCMCHGYGRIDPGPV